MLCIENRQGRHHRPKHKNQYSHAPQGIPAGTAVTRPWPHAGQRTPFQLLPFRRHDPEQQPHETTQHSKVVKARLVHRHYD